MNPVCKLPVILTGKTRRPLEALLSSGVTIPRLMFHQISSLWGLKSDICQKVWMEQKTMNVLWQGDHE
jgi:hypothetical protein